MPLTPAMRDELKKLYNALADRVIEPDDPAYVAQVNSQGQSSAINAIANEIEWQEGGGVCLFTGQRGTGKSTELKRLKQQLETLGMVVFYVDLSEYLLLTKEVEISDFLVSIAGAMSEKVEEKYGGTPGNSGYWERLSKFLQTKVDITDFTVKYPGVDIKAALKNDPDFKQRVQQAARGHIAQLVQEAHGFLAEVVAYVRSQTNDPDKKVVLLVDSVERIRGVGSEAMTVYESVRNLFFGHAEHLMVPLLHIVYTIPPYLSVLAAGAGTLMRGASTRRLVSTHIFKDRCREPDPEGLKILRKVVEKRYPDWKKILHSDALDKLAMSSGGDLRELFRLVRLCLPEVSDDSQLPMTAHAVKPSEDAARREMLPIPAEHLAWLKKITETHDTCLGKDADLPTLAHFLDNRLVLNYRNGSDWYDVHPLLRDVVDAYVVPDA